MRAALQMAAAFVAGAAVASLVIRGSRRQEAPPEAARKTAPAPADLAGAPPLRPTAQEPAGAAWQTPAQTTTPSERFHRAAAEPERDGVERVQRAQIAALQARVSELERKVPRDPEGDTASHARPKLHDFTSAELQAMARNCEVRFDLPRIAPEPYHLPPDLGARLHLSDPEQERVSAAVDASGKDVIAHLRAFYIEATGDAAGADGLAPQALMHEILDKSPPAAMQAARAEIARERAGLPAAPASTIAERYLRYVTSVGDSLQRTLEPTLGAHQAAAVRDALGESQSFMSGCPK
jgi:hypothetical protein